MCKVINFNEYRGNKAAQGRKQITRGNVTETECVRGIIKKFLKFDMEMRCTEVGLTF